MRLKRLFLFGFGVVLALGSTFMLWLFNSDLGRFQPQIQGYLSERLDRDVSMQTLSLELGWPTRIAVTGLTVANAPWGEKTPLLQVDQLDSAVNLWSLFSRNPVIIERLDGNGIKLLLAWNKSGSTNFQFASADSTPSSSRSTLPFVVLRDVNLAASSVDLVKPDHANNITVSKLFLADKPDGMLTAELAGTVNDQLLKFTGELGTFDALIDAKNVRFDGAGQFARLDFKGSMLIDDLAAPNHPVLDLQMSGPDIGDIERYLGLKPAIAGSFSAHITSALKDSANWTFKVDGQVGDFKVLGEGQATGLRDLSTLAVSAQSSGPDLQSFAALFGVTKAPAEPFDLSGSVTRDGPALDIKDIQLNVGPTRLALSGTMNHFPHVKGGSLKLAVAGPDLAHFRNMLNLPGLAEGPFKLNAELKPEDRQEEQLSLQLESSLANLDVRGLLSNDPAYVGSQLQLKVDGKSAAAVLERFSVPGITASPFTVSADVTVGDGMVTIKDGMVTGLYDGDLAIDGDIGYAFLDDKTQLELHLSGPNLERSLLNVWSGARAWQLPYDLQTRLRASAGEILLNNLQLKAGSTVISATTRIPMKPGADQLDITFSGKGPNLEEFLREPADAKQRPVQVPAQPWTASGHLEKQAERLTLSDLRLQVPDLDATASASFPWPLQADEMAFTLNANGSDLAAVLPAIGSFTPSGEAYSVDLEGARSGTVWKFEPSQLQFAGGTLKFGGNVDGLPDFSTTDFFLTVEVPNLQALGTWAGKPLPQESLGLDTRLSGSVDELLFERFETELGGSKMQGQMTISPKDERLAVKLQLNSKSLDLRGILPSKQAELASAEQGANVDGLLIPDTPLNFSILKRFDADADINIDTLVLPDRIINALNLSASLDRGSMQVQRFHSKGLAGDMRASGTLEVLDSGGARVALELHTTDLVPNRQDWKDADPATLPRFNVSMTGNSSGASLRELAAGLNGELDLVASEGFLPGRGLGALNALALEQLVSILAPGLKTEEPTRLLCMAARLNVVDGLVKTDPMVALQTSKILLESTGTLDLKTEALRLDFEVTPTKLLSTSIAGLINPFVTIRGTLAKPTPEINPVSTLFYGGAAAATGGISVVAKSLWNRLRGSSKPCEHLRDEVRKTLAAKQAAQ